MLVDLHGNPYPSTDNRAQEQESTKETQQPADRHTQQPELISASHVTRNTAEPTEKTARDKAHRLQIISNWIQGFLCLFTALAFAAAAYYADIAYQQKLSMDMQIGATITTLWEMEKQTALSSKAATAAEVSASTAQRAFQQSLIDERPYITVRNIGTLNIIHERPIEVNIREVNWGRSLALHVTTQGEVWYGEGAEKSIKTYFAKIPMWPAKWEDAYIVPNAPDSADPNSTFFKYTTISSFPNAPSIKATNYIKSHDRGAVVAGRCWYKDGFGNRYRTDFCFTTLLTGAIAECTGSNPIQ